MLQTLNPKPQHVQQIGLKSPTPRPQPPKRSMGSITAMTPILFSMSITISVIITNNYVALLLIVRSQLKIAIFTTSTTVDTQNPA